MSVGYGGRGVGGKGSGAHLSASTTPKAFAVMMSAHVALAGDLGHVRRQDARAAVGAPDGGADGGPVAPGHGLCVDLPRQPAAETTLSSSALSQRPALSQRGDRSQISKISARLNCRRISGLKPGLEAKTRLASGS